MLFNSFTFLVFAAVFFLVWPLARRSDNLRWGYLCVASFVFYGWWDWRYLFLLLLSGLIDYGAALLMTRFPAARKALLGLSLACNLGILALFKYWNFGVRSLAALSAALGWSIPFPQHDLTLPVGISFYTFQSMSYTIDVYRRQLPVVRNVLHFFAYLSMFPQLVAGPIVRAETLLPQLCGMPQTTRAERILGLQLIAIGYFKKTVIADHMAGFVDDAFSRDVPLPDCLYWWAIAVMFSLQIYCDFSGYSDIARGLAKWMGYEFPLNFNVPYIALGFRDFWSRWHISLSTWFRDYAYIPLGGNARGPLAAHGNMWITMLLSGLWHGANWTFLAWGAWHAALLSLERITRWPDRLSGSLAARLFGILATFLLTLLGWVLFRSQSVTQAAQILSLMMRPGPISLASVRLAVSSETLMLTLAVLGWHVWLAGRGDGNPEELAPASPGWIWILGLTALLVSAVLFRGAGHAFVYFQF